MNEEKTIGDKTALESPADQSKREVLARLGKYAAYTAPVLLITLGAKESKATIGSNPPPQPAPG